MHEHASSKHPTPFNQPIYYISLQPDLKRNNQNDHLRTRTTTTTTTNTSARTTSNPPTKLHENHTSRILPNFLSSPKHRPDLAHPLLNPPNKHHGPQRGDRILSPAHRGARASPARAGGDLLRAGRRGRCLYRWGCESCLRRECRVHSLQCEAWGKECWGEWIEAFLCFSDCCVWGCGL